MKKTISVMLAFIMLLSCFSAFSASAEGAMGDILYSEETIDEAEAALGHFYVKNLPGHIESFKDFKNSAQWSEVSLLGIDLDFLYSSTEALKWSELDVLLKDDSGKTVYGPDGLPLMLITKEDISLAFTNIGMYLQQVIYNVYGGLNMYTVENAVGLANAIGKILYPDFVELNIANFKNYFNNEIPGTNEFYRAVAKLSGFDRIVEANWVPRGKNYCEPVVKALGGYFISFLDDYYTDGLVLSSKLLEGMFKKLITVGPIDYVYDLLMLFTGISYSATYRTPLLALFTHKIPVISNHVNESELNTFSGLLQLVFCNDDCYSANPGNDARFCPLDFPTERIGATTNKDEALIYIYYYLNLCGRYKDNREFFENVITSLRASSELSSVDKMKLEAIISAFFLGGSEGGFRDAVIPLYKENTSSVSASFPDRIKNAFMSFLKKIADYFDYLRKIFTGELEYGQGNSPFN